MVFKIEKIEIIKMDNTKRYYKSSKDWWIYDPKWVVLKSVNNPETVLDVGSVWRNLPLQPHQLECLEEGIIIEVSTADSVEDNYRILPGDSQCGVENA